MGGKDKFFGFLKKSKAGESGAADATVPPVLTTTTTTTTPEQKPELYSTEGSIGMKIVAEPANANLDIVFVHGLTGNRETTWTHENGVFWPELLATDIQGARIMTFGYDADVVKIWGMAGGNNLRNHGKNLASAVSDRRRSCRERPIVFVAHSLGGLVCEQALLYCREGEKNLEKVFQSTRGVIFMGTPHAGADLAKWGYKLAHLLNVIRATNSKILDPLRRDSDVLTAVQQQFQKLLRQPGVAIEIYCFFEEKPVVGVGLIVPESSATLSQYPNQSIAANHMDMTKFSGKRDEGYQRVLSRVQDNLEIFESANKIDMPQKHPEHEKRSKCHQLFRTSQYERHKERNPHPVKGTCVWFLQHPNYVTWRDSRHSSLLWVSADPGCGKSVLSKFLADDVLQATKSRTTCYFFFKDDDEDQKSATNALCAILHQLFEQKAELLGYATKSFDSNKEDLMKSIDLMWSLLITASTDSQAGEIICILDALDECRQSQLSILLSKICSFYATQPDTVALKFLLTSRPLEHIESQFHRLSQKIPAIRLAGEEDTDQIRQEIDLVIGNKISTLHQRWPDNQEAINALRDEFAKVENRTYLWLTLIFDLIDKDLKSLTKRGRKTLFGTLPTSVDATYTAILNQSNDKEQARKLLQIVCAATRPLSIQEMYIAVSIQEEDKSTKDLELFSDNYLKTMIRNWCGLFVSVIDGRVYLLHQTAKEFLILSEVVQDDPRTISSQDSDNIWKHSLSVSNSNFVLAQSCMWYLRLEELYTSKCLGPWKPGLERPLEQKALQLVSDNKFLDYSTRNWAIHFRSTQNPKRCSLISIGFGLCDISANEYKSWEVVFWDTEYRSEKCVGFSSLILASLLGLLEIVSRLLSVSECDVNEADNYGSTPLLEAASEGHDAVVRQLLGAPGIDVNKADNNGSSPLYWATWKGHEAVVRQLLGAPGIDVNKANNKGSTPLYWAAWKWHDAVVRQLLGAPGIEVNKADNNGLTPLLRAAWKGHEALVRQLLGAPGIDVNKVNNKGWTPLCLAAWKGHEAVVRQLLGAPGIDVNKADNNGWTPLYWAASEGHVAIVRQLLRVPRFDVNKADNNGWTPLYWAAWKGHEAVVRQLLGAPGIDLHKPYNDGQTPLQVATSKGHKEVVRQLLAAPGIEPTQQDIENAQTLLAV